MHLRPPATVALLLSSLVLAAPPGFEPDVLWPGPEGEPLPFRSYEEIEEFLATAPIARLQVLRGGVTLPLKLTLNDGRIRMHAVFRDVKEFKHMWKGAETWTVRFRDDYRFEVVAYRLSRLLGLDNVPPTVLREFDRVGGRRVVPKRGSLQAWVENAMTERSRPRDQTPPDPLRWARQYHLMIIFDNLVYNQDRNQGNILIGPDWKLWFIDATRAFRFQHQLPQPKAIVWCERRLWGRLQELDDVRLREGLREVLERPELDALLARRRRLVRHIGKLIERKGEQAVLYDLP